MQAKQDPTAVGAENSEDNLSYDALIARLSQGSQDETEATNAETEEVQGEESEEVEPERVETESDEETEEQPEVEAEETEGEEIDLLNLEPEQIQALAKKGKSRLLERVGELTAQKKALQAQLEELGSKQQSAKVIPQEQNPFGDITKPEEIRAKYEDFERTLETTDRLLDEYEDYALDDVIEVQGQSFTKKQIKLANRNAKDALTKYLPAQASHLQKLESYKTANQQWQEAAKQEVPEISDEKSEIGKAFKQLVSDPLVQILKDKLPELGVQIEYLLAHAARSKFGTAKKVAQGAGTKLKVKPPASPVGAGAQRTTQGQNSKYADAMKRFEETGSADDWIAAQKFKGR